MQLDLTVNSEITSSSTYQASSFGHLFLDKKLLNQISRAEFEKPTSIQAQVGFNLIRFFACKFIGHILIPHPHFHKKCFQAIPAILRGRDVLGLAETGSGKTLAYLWPAIIHIINQDELSEGDGPIAVVVVPTRQGIIKFIELCIINKFLQGIGYSGTKFYSQLMVMLVYL